MEAHTKKTPREHKIIALLTITLGTGLLQAAGIGYPDLLISSPTSLFPSNFPAFTPPVNNSLNVPNTAPQISEWTRQNQPSDTMVLTGESLSSYSAVPSDGRDTRFVIYGGGITTDGLIQRLDGRQCAITLPDTLPQNEMYLMWPRNSEGFGRPVGINQTEAWWVGPDMVNRGKRFSVYGQSLTLGTNTSYLYIEGYGWITSVEANSYKADFICPSDLGNGTYSAYAHNGHGREYGWARPLTFEVLDERVWNNDTNTWVNVKNYGAQGNGSSDDWQAVVDALAACSSGDTLYFPEGTYLLATKIQSQMKSGLRFAGDGLSLTKITTHPNFASNPRYDNLLYFERDNMVVQDLTISTGPYMTTSGTAAFGQNAENIIYERVCFSSEDSVRGNHALKQLYSENILFKDCRLEISHTLAVQYTSEIFFDQCEILGVHDSNVLVGGNPRKLSVTGCRVANLDDSDRSLGDGWAKGRFVSCDNNGANNIYIGNITTENLQPRVGTARFTGSPIAITPYVPYDSARGTQIFRFSSLPSGLDVNSSGVWSLVITASAVDQTRGYWVRSIDMVNNEVEVWVESWLNPKPSDVDSTIEIRDHVDQNASEQILFEHGEGGGSRFRGSPASATADSITFASSLHTGAEHYYCATIVDGKGTGQLRTVTNSVGNTFYFDEPWSVIPDGSSVIVMGNYFHKIAVYNNSLDARDPSVNTASTGVQLTGGGHSVYVDSNTINETETGLSVYSDGFETFQAGVNTISPDFFFLFKNNTITDTKYGLLIDVDLRSNTADLYSDYSVLGLVYRKNTLDGQDYGLVYGYNNNATGLSHTGATVFDQNIIGNFDTFMTDSDKLRHQIWMGNTITGPGTGVGFRHSGDHLPALKNNQWSGLSSIYQGDPDTLAVLENPKRVISLTSLDLDESVVVYNSGTESMSWSASESSSWLSLSKSSGVVADESSEDSFTVTVDTNTAPQQGTAVITINAAGQTNQLTVTYEAVVEDNPLTGIDISPQVSEVDEGIQVQLSCIATYSNAATSTVVAEWSVSPSGYVTIVDGLLSAGAVASDQMVSVSAQYGGLSNSLNVLIKDIPLPTYTISYTAGNNGSISGSVNQVIFEGDNSSAVEAIADAGYHFARWEGSVTSGQNPLILTGVSTDMVINAVFEIDGTPQQYTVSFTAGANGALSGDVSQTVPTNSNLTAVTATPNTGYQFVRWEGAVNTIQNPLQLNNIISNMNLTAVFQQTGGSGGSGLGAGITREVWYNIPTENISLLTSNSRYPSSPDRRELVSRLEGPQNFADNFGSRTHGYLTPPITGSYTFWVAGDDSCELWLSTDDSVGNAVLVAQTLGPTDFREWDRNPSQQSASISLQAGQRYYIQVLHKEGSSGDHVSVAWQGPGISQSVIPGTYLEPNDPSEPLFALSGISIDGPLSMYEQSSAQYTCSATYSDGRVVGITPDWSVTSGPATISASGMVTSENTSANQSAVISATYGDIVESHSISVQYATALNISGPEVAEEHSTASYTCVVSYSDGSSRTETASWLALSTYATISDAGLLSPRFLPHEIDIVISASAKGLSDSYQVTLIPSGDRIIYPLEGFEGKTVRADLYDHVTEEIALLGIYESPDELIISGLSINQWYWLIVREYDSDLDSWVPVQANWISTHH